MHVKQILNELVYVNITVAVAEKDFAIHVQIMKCLFQQEVGHHQFVCAMHVKRFYRRIVTKCLVNVNENYYILHIINYKNWSYCCSCVYHIKSIVSIKKYSIFYLNVLSTTLKSLRSYSITFKFTSRSL